MKDLYKIIGVARDASPDEIRKAYHALARKLHPDHNPDNKKAEDKFKDVTMAYGVLSNQEKRALYDRYGEESLVAGFTAPPEPKPRKKRASKPKYQDDEDTEEEVAEGRPSSWEDPSSWGAFTGGVSGGVRGRVQDAFVAMQGENIEDVLELTLEEAHLGTSKEVQVIRPTGQASHHRVLIPAGMLESDKIRMAGQGMPGVMSAGDLFLQVSFAKHPWFTPKGQDLSLDLPITFPEAVRGAMVEVPTLHGPVRLRVPPGSSSGKRLRLSGKGLANRKTRQCGDLYVTLLIQVPQHDLPEVEAFADSITEYYGDVRGHLSTY